jgi:hypothetical protein
MEGGMSGRSSVTLTSSISPSLLSNAAADMVCVIIYMPYDDFEEVHGAVEI